MQQSSAWVYRAAICVQSVQFYPATADTAVQFYHMPPATADTAVQFYNMPPATADTASIQEAVKYTTSAQNLQIFSLPKQESW